MTQEKLKLDEATDERSTTIDIGGTKFNMVLTTKATKEIAKRYGGLENLGEKLLKTENFEMALDEVVWLISLLVNQSIMIHNLKNKADQRELISVEEIELLTTPFDLSDYKHAIMTSMMKGTQRNVESEPSKRGSRVKDEELFTRLIYYATAHLGRKEVEAWLMPIGYLLDLWECHKQFVGISKAKESRTIDDVIPEWI